MSVFDWFLIPATRLLAGVCVGWQVDKYDLRAMFLKVNSRG